MFLLVCGFDQVMISGGNPPDDMFILAREAKYQLALKSISKRGLVNCLQSILAYLGICSVQFVW